MWHYPNPQVSYMTTLSTCDIIYYYEIGIYLAKIPIIFTWGNKITILSIKFIIFTITMQILS